MIKKWIISFIIPISIFASHFNPLPEAYTIQVGTKDAPSTIVEYFSLSCPLCLQMIKKEFKEIHEKYVETGKVFWIFHPDPQDITTLQFMMCLEKLPQSKKWPFFWEIIKAVKPTSPGRSCFLMQELLKRYDVSIPLLHDINFLEKSAAYKEAFTYLNQPGIPEELPFIEKDGNKIKGLPNKELIDEIFIQGGAQ